METVGQKIIWQIRPVSITIWLHILPDSILGVLVFVILKTKMGRRSYVLVFEGLSFRHTRSILAIFPPQEHVDKSVRQFGFQRAKCTSFHKRKNHTHAKRPNACYRLRYYIQTATKMHQVLQYLLYTETYKIKRIFAHIKL